MPTIFLECSIVYVGNSTDNSITTTVTNGLNCPASVDKTNWLGGYNHSDTFSITQHEDQIIVSRTDSSIGWEINLKFICCKDKGIRMFIIG